MPLVKAQCTNCNGFLEVDSSKEAAICPHCGTPYIVEKAINLFINNQDLPSLNSAKKLIDIRELKEANDLLSQIIENHPDYADAWQLKYTIAENYINDKKYSDAQSILYSIVKHSPDNGEAWLKLFIASLKNKTDLFYKNGEEIPSQNIRIATSAKELMDIFLKEKVPDSYYYQLPTINHQIEMAKKLSGGETESIISETIQEETKLLDSRCFSVIQSFRSNIANLDGWCGQRDLDTSFLFYEYAGTVRIQISGYTPRQYKVNKIENNELILESTDTTDIKQKFELLYVVNEKLIIKEISTNTFAFYLTKDPKRADSAKASLEHMIEKRRKTNKCIRCGEKLSLFTKKCPNGCIQNL